MKQYQELIKRVYEEGVWTENRTGVDTVSKIGEHIEFDMSANEFPLLTLRRIYWRLVCFETLWHLRAETNIRWLQENEVHMWDAWATPDGYVGPLYGYQWRRFGESTGACCIDQLQSCINQIKAGSTSRRLVVTAWNPYDVDSQSVPPCHFAFQFHVRPNDVLDLQFFTRSTDVMVGLPYDMASYGLLLRMVCQLTGKRPGKVVGSLGDTHIYKCHEQQAIELLYGLTPKPSPKFHWTLPAPISIDKYNWQMLVGCISGYLPVSTQNLKAVV